MNDNILSFLKRLLEIAKRLEQKIELAIQRSAVHDLMNKPVWNVKELCIILSLTENQVYKLTSQNRIPYSKERGMLMFEPELIMQWVRDHRCCTIYQMEQRAADHLKKK